MVNSSTISRVEMSIRNKEKRDSALLVMRNGSLASVVRGDWVDLQLGLNALAWWSYWNGLFC